MKKVFRIADIRKLEQQVSKGEISYSRMVEIMNEMANLAHSKVKKLPIPAVSHRTAVETDKFGNNIHDDYEEDPDCDDSNECCEDCGCYHGHHPWCDEYGG